MYLGTLEVHMACCAYSVLLHVPREAFMWSTNSEASYIDFGIVLYWL